MGHFKPCYSPNEFNHKIIRITDNPEANIIQYFPQTTEFIHNAVTKQEPILVHCLAGVSRSPTVVAAYLMVTEKRRFKEALALIKRVRPFVNPNPGFLNQLRLFQEMNYAGHLGHEQEEQ
ncbi:hypothetical protein G6F57_010447 [Rhizopus arrhizus]|uniref:Protein-tyrosine-phosphatase n=2 Tax=Rhizopus TaxID=4842 RepID=A0A9P7BQT6_RHIOR|nr:hypothetical protein G6F23_011343 [Rhizopus arrhizus]KAG1046539.1 hypothetical protein G6F43_010980 [Rhizopus delemar]KAG0763616.1 hypothetical protein G6F24_005873 [Rhizopus arrhizus]KAG0791797.1 hypothetical protein G6F21_004821 [Rhizopus arrhizus]KAG0798531.1 hypothetical protein G6F22_004129 [Rhizopus arrhizus]